MDNIFRTKKYRDTSSKIKSQDDIVSGTLDSIHQNVVTNLKNMNVEELNSKRDILYQRISELDNAIQLSDIIEYNKLKDELQIIDALLNSSNPIEKYYLKHADIMLKYYGNQDKTKLVSGPSISDQNTFLKYITVKNANDTGQSKKELFDEYVARMKLSNIQSGVEERPSEHCMNCNVSREEISSEGILVCPSCGSEEYMMVVSDFPSFRDPPKERNNYAYKKINHLNEILNQFQAKESTIIPDEVMNEVVCEIKKRRIQNVAELTEKDMREILKKLNRSKYYEHATHILSRLNGNPPPTITPEIEEKIRAMFQEIQAPFLIYCPDDRTNFLSYSYILYKFFELLDLDEYKVYFPLLKSRDRLIAHDEIWKKICTYLQWEFISSV